MTRWLMATVAVLVLAGEARGDGWTTGNVLHEWCSGETVWHQRMCAGFVSGIADSMVNAPVWEWSTCFPPFPNTVTRGQLTDIVKRWLEQHPENRHLGAAGLVTAALSEAFPCE